MKTVIGRRIERHVELQRYEKTGALLVEIKRPYHRKWVRRIYKPTAASLERVKRLVGYSLGPNGMLHTGTIIHVSYFSRTI